MPKGNTDVLCAVCCNEAAAFIINSMYPESIHKKDIAEKYREKYPELNEKQAIDEVCAVISKLRENTGTEGG